MSTSLSERRPESVKSLRTGPLFLPREQVPPLLVVGQTPNGFGRVGVIQAGSFACEPDVREERAQIRLDEPHHRHRDWLPARRWPDLQHL